MNLAVVLMSLFASVNASAQQEAARELPVCGLSGDIAERLADCKERRYFTRGSEFKLVTRTQGLIEVWQDTKTKLIWSYGRFEEGHDYEDAVELCQNSERAKASKGELAIDFRLPYREEVTEAFRDGGYIDILDYQLAESWTASRASEGRGVSVFSNAVGTFQHGARSREVKVHGLLCVARVTK